MRLDITNVPLFQRKIISAYKMIFESHPCLRHFAPVLGISYQKLAQYPNF